jgi:hypothetical protein
MVNESSVFSILLREYSPYKEKVSPQLKEAMSSLGEDVLQTFKDYYSAVNSSKPLESLETFFKDLDAKAKSLSDVGIVQGWRNVYKGLPESLKESLNIKETNFLGVPMPSAVAASVTNILSGPINSFTNLVQQQIPTALIQTGMMLPTEIETQLAKATNTIGRLVNKNVQSVLDTVAVSVVNHASNLVPDFQHAVRMAETAVGYYTEVASALGDAGEFFLKTVNINPFSSGSTGSTLPNMVLGKAVEGLDFLVGNSGLEILEKIKTPISNFASPKSSNVI